MSLMEGSWVRSRLSVEDRRFFEEEFAFALAGARFTYEVEPLAEVVRGWWKAAGGDPDVADADRWRAQQDATITRRPHPVQQDPTRWVDRTGPAVFAALHPEDRDRFAAEFAAAVVGAAESFDHGGLVEVVKRWWGAAFRSANPEHAAKEREMMDRIEAGDESVFESRELGA